jgi:hypothetical protein
MQGAKRMAFVNFDFALCSMLHALCGFTHTPQGGAIEGNAAYDILMVDQGDPLPIDNTLSSDHNDISY